MIKKFENFNESLFNEYDFNFTTKLDNMFVDMPNYDDNISDFNITDAKVYWKLDIDMKEQGIEDIIPTVSKIVIDLDIEYENEDYDYFKEEGDRTYKKSEVLTFEGGDIIIEDRQESDTIKLPYRPREINVDYKNKKVKVAFESYDKYPNDLD